MADGHIRHALDHRMFVFDQEEVAMVIGPSATGLLLEIGVVLDEDDPRVIHAMLARPRFLAYLKGTLS